VVGVPARTVSRRALLGAGALLVAGCGAPDAPPVNAREVWGEQYRASLDASRAYRGVAGAGDLAERARRRADRAGAAYARAGGAVERGGSVPAASSLQAVLAAERRALRAHVAAVGVLADRESRELLANLISESAAAESALLERLHEAPAAAAFPGQPLDPR
jgi:hypothetical protein